MREGLTYKKLKDIGVVITGNTPSTKDKENYSSDDYCFVKPSDIAKDGVSIIKDSESYISEKGYNSSRKLPKGSVLTTCIGIIGKVGILEIDATCNQQINAIIPFRTILPKYLALAILSVKSQLEAMANAPVVPIINKGDFSNVEIPVPSFEEQERIVAELDLLTEIIDKQKQQLKELDTLAQSIFYDMFGNPQTDERGWNMEKLSSICVSISDGSHNPPKGGKKSDYLMLSSKNIKDGVLSLEEPRYLSKDEFSLENKRKNVKKGDILLTIVGTIGRCCLFDSSKNIVFQRSVAILKPNDTTNNLFLMYQMIMLRMVFENEAKGVAQKGIYLRQLGNIMVIVPPKGLQDSLAQKIQAIESQKESINRSLAESQKLFDYTMDKYFG